MGWYVLLDCSWLAVPCHQLPLPHPLFVVFCFFINAILIHVATSIVSWAFQNIVAKCSADICAVQVLASLLLKGGYGRLQKCASCQR